GPGGYRGPQHALCMALCGGQSARRALLRRPRGAAPPDRARHERHAATAGIGTHHMITPGGRRALNRRSVTWAAAKLPQRARGGLRIIALGYMVRGPLGGMSWSDLHYTMGLADLGHDVYFVEDSDDYPSCYDPVRDATGTDPNYGLSFAHRAFLRA